MVLSNLNKFCIILFNWDKSRSKLRKLNFVWAANIFIKVFFWRLLRLITTRLINFISLCVLLNSWLLPIRLKNQIRNIIGPVAAWNTLYIGQSLYLNDWAVPSSDLGNSHLVINYFCALFCWVGAWVLMECLLDYLEQLIFRLLWNRLLMNLKLSTADFICFLLIFEFLWQVIRWMMWFSHLFIVNKF